MSLLRNTYLWSMHCVVAMVVGAVIQTCSCIWKHMPDPGHEKCTEHNIEEFRGSLCGCPSAHLSLQCDLSYRFKHKTFFLISSLRGCGIIDACISLATQSTSGPCRSPTRLWENKRSLPPSSPHRRYPGTAGGRSKLNIQGASKLNGMHLVWLYLFKIYFNWF